MRKKMPLIVEPYPQGYKGLEFLTVVRFNDENLLTIVDNVDARRLTVYVLDYITQLSTISEEQVIRIAHSWHEKHSEHYPISIEFSKLGVAREMSKIVRSFSVDYVTRVIGPIYEFPIGTPDKTRKKKRKPITKDMMFEDKFSNKYS